MTFAAVIFDLDGTLLDTLRDIADAANQALAVHGFPTHPMDAYRYYVGDGVVTLFTRTLPPEACREDTIAACAAVFREAYGRGWNVHTRPYPGIQDLLNALSERCCRTAVLSNKPDEFTQRCVGQLLAGHRFAIVRGQRSGVPLKPDPTAALEIRDHLGVPAHDIVYLGDTAVDMQTAIAAGMFPVGAAWGFRPVEELETHGARTVIADPLELLALLPGEPGLDRSPPIG